MKLEGFQRKNNLKKVGQRENKSEFIENDVVSILNLFLQKSHKFDERTLECVQRLGPFQKGKRRDVLARFSNFEDNAQVTLWRGHYELTGEYEDLLRIRNRGSSPQKGRESVVTWLELEKSTIYSDPATMGYHHLDVVEDLGTMFSSPSQEHLVSVKNVDEDQMNFVEVCTN